MFRVRNCSWHSDKIPDSVSGFSTHRNEVLRRRPGSKANLQTGFAADVKMRAHLVFGAADIHSEIVSLLSP